MATPQLRDQDERQQRRQVRRVRRLELEQLEDLPGFWATESDFDGLLRTLRATFFLAFAARRGSLESHVTSYGASPRSPRYAQKRMVPGRMLGAVPASRAEQMQALQSPVSCGFPRSASAIGDDAPVVDRGHVLGHRLAVDQDQRIAGPASIRSALDKV